MTAAGLRRAGGVFAGQRHLYGGLSGAEPCQQPLPAHHHRARRKTLRRPDRRQRRGESGAAALALLRYPGLRPIFRRTPPMCSPTPDRGRRRRRGASPSSSITCRRKTTSGCASECRKAEFVPCRDLYFAARMIKTDEEIALLTKVGELTERVTARFCARYGRE